MTRRPISFVGLDGEVRLILPARNEPTPSLPADSRSTADCESRVDADESDCSGVEPNGLPEIQ